MGFVTYGGPGPGLDSTSHKHGSSYPGRRRKGVRVRTFTRSKGARDLVAVTSPGRLRLRVGLLGTGGKGRDAGRQRAWKRLFLDQPGQAEVQAVFSDGAVSLHTRSLKYGKVSWTFLLSRAD